MDLALATLSTVNYYLTFIDGDHLLSWTCARLAELLCFDIVVMAVSVAWTRDYKLNGFKSICSYGHMLARSSWGGGGGYF